MLKRVLAGAVIAVLLAGLGIGVVYARSGGAGSGGGPYQEFVDRVAKILGKSPSDVQHAFVTTREQMIDQAVQEGRISKERAAKLKARIEKTGRPLLPGRFHGRAVVGVVTKVEGSTLTLRTPHGTATVQLAKDTKVRERGRLVSASQIKVGDRVAVLGRPTSEQARAVIIGPGHGRLAPIRHRLLKDAAGFLGTKPGQLRQELRSGKSLAQIAGPERTPRLIQTLVSDVDRMVDAAQQEGRLSPQRATRIKSHAQELVTRAVNHVWGKKKS